MEEPPPPPQPLPPPAPDCGPLTNEGKSKIIIRLTACRAGMVTYSSLMNTFRDLNGTLRHYWRRRIDISPTRHQQTFKSTILNKRILICVDQWLAQPSGVVCCVNDRGRRASTSAGSSVIHTEILQQSAVYFRTCDQRPTGDTLFGRKHFLDLYFTYKIADFDLHLPQSGFIGPCGTGPVNRR